MLPNFCACYSTRSCAVNGRGRVTISLTTIKLTYCDLYNNRDFEKHLAEVAFRDPTALSVAGTRNNELRNSVPKQTFAEAGASHSFAMHSAVDTHLFGQCLTFLSGPRIALITAPCEWNRIGAFLPPNV